MLHWIITLIIHSLSPLLVKIFTFNKRQCSAESIVSSSIIIQSSSYSFGFFSCKLMALLFSRYHRLRYQAMWSSTSLSAVPQAIQPVGWSLSTTSDTRTTRDVNRPLPSLILPGTSSVLLTVHFTRIAYARGCKATKVRVA